MPTATTWPGGWPRLTRGGALLASYTYDANGNRTSVTTSGGTIAATYDDQDRILTFGDRAYTHTAHGEVAELDGLERDHDAHLRRAG